MICEVRMYVNYILIKKCTCPYQFIKDQSILRMDQHKRLIPRAGKPLDGMYSKTMYVKNQHRAQCTEEAEREVGGGCTNIMMTEKLWSGRNDRRHYSCSICEMEKWPPDKWPRLFAVQWLAHHHMYVLSDTSQSGKFQVGHSNKLANMVTSDGRFSWYCSWYR